MIRLIVSDLDGTLLNDKKEVSERTREYLKSLTAKGIRFAAASGRGREDVSLYFQDFPCAMVTDNGASAYTEEGEKLFSETLSCKETMEVMKQIDPIAYMHYFVVGKNHVYVSEPETESFLEEAQYYFRSPIQKTRNWEEVFRDDEIVKFSINTGWDGRNEERGIQQIRELGVEEHFSPVLSGEGWLELMKAGVSKGNALRRLAGHYGIAMEEMLVFGDYLNDLNMLSVTPNSYAMCNGHEEVKKHCRYTTTYSNNEDGVVRELEKIFGEIE